MKIEFCTVSRQLHPLRQGLFLSLTVALPPREIKKKERMWSSYHELRVSDKYTWITLVKQFKQNNKQTTQKSEGIRKQLIPQPITEKKEKEHEDDKYILKT